MRDKFFKELGIEKTNSCDSIKSICESNGNKCHTCWRGVKFYPEISDDILLKVLAILSNKNKGLYIKPSKSKKDLIQNILEVSVEMFRIYSDVREQVKELFLYE